VRASLNHRRQIGFCIAILLTFAASGILTVVVIEEARVRAIAVTESYSAVVGPGSENPVLSFYRSILPARYGQFVGAVDLVDIGDLTDDPTDGLCQYDLHNLEYFPELYDLSISGCVDEKQLLSLSGLPNISFLELRSEQVTDEVVRHFTSMCPNIRVLVIKSSAVTDASMKYISGLASLERLFLVHSKFHASAFDSLLFLRHLDCLIVDPDKEMISDDELAELQKFLPIERGY
jgi:hypothetical protein